MTGKKRATASDLKKIDEHVLGEKDYADIPELTDEDFARGIWHQSGKALPNSPRGRPKSKSSKTASTFPADKLCMAQPSIPAATTASPWLSVWPHCVRKVTP